MKRKWATLGFGTATAVLVLLAGCSKSADAACDNVRHVLLVRDTDAWTQQCLQDLQQCDLSHPDDNQPLYNCLARADREGDVAACMLICPADRYHGRSYMAFGQRISQDH